LRSGTNPLSKVRQTPPTFPNFTSVRRISPHNAVAMQTDFTVKPICCFASVLCCQTRTA
jgi:hypothetical protein